ncbi:hypothetical protein G7048_26285 (plasmid) [Diaphorobacter sp. HDW4B]|uniref:hypothetical protein n=1 Tax=Diaphorobacter sp. HDW4B TaxID=2714925 RepID=UPI00140A737B|nr:hypothetical protein [Diaphorobacter sp. HDW4B]QIL74001.1 hypothetical protein G7048_26285 [Diaphorobacter sp. HDW4B]
MFEWTQAVQTGDQWFVPKPALEKSVEWQYGILIVMSALAVAAIVYAFVHARRHRRSDALWIVAGAALASFWEPLGDLLAHVTYHEVNQLNLTASFGFHTPLWVLPTYIVFFGAPILMLLQWLERGVSVKAWMLYFFASIPGALLFEVPLLEMGSIEYYGANQPLKILGYPLWMAFVNSGTMFVVTTAVYFLRKSPFIGTHPILLAPLLPMLVLGANAGAGLPLSHAINSAASLQVVNLMAVASMALSTLYAWICGKLLESDR